MIKKLFSSQLRINMASGVVTTVVNTVVMVVSFPIYLHFLGYERYGVWLVLTAVLSFAQLGNLGIDQAVMKLVAEEHGRGDIEGVQRYITTAVALLCLSGIVVLIMILVFKTQIIAALNLTDENSEIASLLLPYIGCLSIYIFIVQAINASLSGLDRMDLANYIQSIGRIVAVTVAAILLYIGRGIESLLIGNIFSYVFIHIVSLICIWRIARIHLLRIDNLDSQRCRSLLRFGGTVFSGSVLNMFLSPFNKLMLSRYAGVSTIPVYEIAFRGSMQIRGFIETGLRALMPEISRISGNMTRYARDRIFQINRGAMKLIFLFGIPMYGVLITFAPLLLRVWLRDRFVESLPGVLRIMLVGTFLSLLGVPAYFTLMGIGHVRHNLVSHIIQSTFNAAIIIGCVLLFSTVSAGTIVFSVSSGMGLSTIYLIWRRRKAFKHLICENVTSKTDS
jgi:O-antigen/teichoic acid export membrane protein